MKRRTKKAVFISALVITTISLFAIGGKHHQFASHNHCHSMSHCNDSHSKKLRDEKELKTDNSSTLEKENN